MPIVQQRRGTKAELDASTEIFAAGQIIFESDTVNIKVGDGSRQYAQLPYLSIAQDAVGNDQLAADSVDDVVLQDNSVFTAAIQNAAVTAGKLAEQAVTSAIIANNAIVEEKIADNAVTSNKIPTDAITTAKIAGDSVTGAEIAPSAVTSTELAAGAVLETHVSSFAISTDKLGAFSVTDTKLAADAVTTVKVEDNAITYAKIQDVSTNDRILGRVSSGAGDVQEIHCTAFARDILNDSSAAAVRATIGAVEQSDIDTAIANLVNSAPDDLNTLNELAEALGDDDEFSVTVTNSIATKMPKDGGTFSGDVQIGLPSGAPRDLIFPRQSTSSKHAIRFTHSGISGFSNPPNELDFIRLYEDSQGNHAGLGISSGFLNIGTKGTINFAIYTNGVLRTQYNLDGSVEHGGGTHTFGGTIDCNAYVYGNGYRASLSGSATNTAYGKESDGDTGAYFPGDDEYAISTDGETRMKFRDRSSGSNNKYSDIVVQRSPGCATFKAGTNLDSSGWFIIDSSGSPVALNYFTSNNVSLCHGGGGVVVGPNSNPGAYKLTVNGKSYFQNDVKIGTAGQLFIPDGTAADPAVAFVSDTSSGGPFGIYRSSNGSFNITHGGANRLSITTGGVIHTGSAGTVMNGTVTITNGLDVDQLAQSGASTGNLLKWTGTEWAGATISLNDNTDVTAFPSSGEVLYYNGTNWLGAAPSTFLSAAYIGDLSNVSSATPSTGDVLTWNGTAWAPAVPTGGSGGGAAGDSLWSSVSLLVPFETSANSVTHADGQQVSGTESGTSGSPSSAVSTDGKFSNGWRHYQGTVTYSTGTFNSSNWTVEFWFKRNADYSFTTQRQAMKFGDFIFRHTTSNNFILYDDDDGSAIGSFGTAALNTWEHYAIVYQNGTMRLYKGGTQVASSTGTLSAPSSVVIGRSSNSLYNFGLDDLRVTDAARYPDGTSFSVPTAAAPTSGSGGSGGSGSSTLAGLTDVTVSNAASGEVLYWNGSGWVNQDLGLHAVATSGSYNDLTNKPTYATVASSGSYNDLTNVPSTFAPSAHVHPISAVTNLQTELNGKSNTGHGHAQSEITNLVSDLAGKASLVGGKVPSSELPSFVDDVLEYNGTSSFPASGETGKIYVDTSTNKTHRWTGSTYVEISASPGSTDSVTEGSTNLYHTNARVDARILNSLLDEDNLSSDSDQAAPTQQSVKAYVDANKATLMTLITGNDSDISVLQALVSQKANTSSLSTVATSGSYNDLLNVPSTFTPSTHVHPQSAITNLVSDLAAKANTSSLSAVATSGQYSDITGRVQSIDDLSDVSSASPSAGDILRYNGTSWVVENPELISTINTTTSNRAIALNYTNAQSFVVNMQSSQLHTVSFTNWPTTNPLRVLTATMVMKFPGTGGGATTATVQWPSTVKWPGGTAPTITNKAGAIDIFSFVSYDNGASWLGFTGGQEF